jgi:ABC-type dipeptide/oligopeptide/nickel transport system permease component
VNVIPGDPATTLLGAFATDDSRRALEQALGLNQPLPVQYGKWLWRVVHLNFGVSYVRNVPVWPITMEAFKNTLILFPISFTLFVTFGLAAGIGSATRRGGFRDKALMTAALIGTSMPVFWLGLMLILVFAIELQWFPAGGMTTLGQETTFFGTLWHALLPATVAAAIPAGTFARVVRSAVAEMLESDFVLSLRARGLSDRVVLRHVLRNALPPIVAILGLQIGYLLGGQVFAEVVFNWPGIGYLLYNAILERDLPVIQAATLVVSVAFVVVNLIADIIYGIVNPRLTLFVEARDG